MRLGQRLESGRVKLSGLACELVIPPEHLDHDSADLLNRQFARSPYAVGYTVAGHGVTLVSLHVIWGSDTQERVNELRAIAEWLARWSRDKHAWDHNLITVGDFNIEKVGDPFHVAFTSTGLSIPEAMVEARRSVFAKDAGGAAYDQIAWFEESRTSRPLSLHFRSGGSFDFRDHALPSRGLTATELSWRISDHLPLWAEFSTHPIDLASA